MALSETIHHLIEHYGALGVGLGGGIEGESAVVIGGAMAREGLINPWSAALAAFIGAWISCQLFFLVGRSQRDHRMVHRITEKPLFARALRMIDRHPRLFCFGFRFIYGFRVMGPIAISMSHVRARDFAWLQMLSAAIWGPGLVLLGYSFGKVIVEVVKMLLTPAHALIAAALTILVLLGWLQWRRRRAARTVDPERANG
ncbi:DedA family protein [Sphingomonas sp.]|uniref:DedA family protein n=1 Tax=Sphingomonas sp. TaxID=28214 RepID=UPI00286AAF97|nr:DedA family protein [Sphingomonas sp.]